MYGATPGIYSKFEAAELAAQAYQLEEEKRWLVAFKQVDGRICYKPIMEQDVETAANDDYHVCTKSMTPAQDCEVES